MTSQLKFTIDLAKKAGDRLLRAMDSTLRVYYKKDEVRHPTFALEEEIEDMIVASILKKFPGHNIIREEGENIDHHSDYTWIIDPIDGTRYFIDGIKLFTVSIGLWHSNDPLMGVIYNPGVKDCYYAQKGHGSFLNARKLKLSNVTDLARSIIALDITKTDKLTNKEQALFLKRIKNILSSCFRFRAFGSGSLSLCYLAQGHLEAYFDLSGKEEVLDLGAGLAIAREAGAKITGLNGKFQGMDTSHLLVTNVKIHDKLLKLLNDVQICKI